MVDRTCFGRIQPTSSRASSTSGLGDKPAWWNSVYTWSDSYVLEDEGRIVACGGLWDRGKNVRERWRNARTGDERSLEATALLDFGFAPGREDAMAALVRYFVGETAVLGRDHLLAPLDQLPELSARLRDLKRQWRLGAST